jgi:hypothetical protein
MHLVHQPPVLQAQRRSKHASVVHAWPIIAVRWVMKMPLSRGFVSASAMFLAVGMYFVVMIPRATSSRMWDEEVAPLDVLRLGAT